MSRRVAFVGNMNNNHFAMMRYFRDLGVDAHLLMYKYEFDHFHPPRDTWHWEKWEGFVHRLPFSNGGWDSWAQGRGALRVALGDFDVFIGNGIAPVIFDRIGRKLDLFIPYAEGIEFVVEHHFRWRQLARSIFSLVRKRRMETALRRAVKAIVTFNVHPHSQDTYDRLGLKPVRLPIPMLYVEPVPEDPTVPEIVCAHVARMRRSRLVVLSHSSLMWQRVPPGWQSKRNNWLVEGFAAHVRESGDTSAVLGLFEFGRDVAATKALVAEFGLADQVLWFPLLARREIMWVLRHVDVGGGEYAGMMWGGCGWEFLASGVPMLHRLDDPGQYRAGVPLPPFFNVQSPADIAAVLRTHDRARFLALGRQCREWFQTHQGAALARRYLNLIEPALT